MMTDAFWIAFFASLPALIAAVSAAVIALVGVTKVNAVHKQVNSRMDQLIQVTASSSRAEGALDAQTQSSAAKVVIDAADTAAKLLDLAATKAADKLVNTVTNKL